MTAQERERQPSRSRPWLFCYERDHGELSVMASIRRMERKAARKGSTVVQFIVRHDGPAAILKNGEVID